MEVLRWAGGGAAIVVAATLVAGVVGLARGNDRGRPWLTVLLAINAGRGNVSLDTLRAVRPVDIVLLLLAAVAYAGFWPGAGNVWWMVLALGQPLMGIVILLITQLWGRSGLLGGALVLSILMVAGGTWAAPGWLGVAASVLLLVGDFGTTERPHRLLVPVLAAGYAGLAGWFVWDAVVLLG